MTKHNFNGWIKDPADHRDYSFKLAQTAELPESVDLRKYASIIEDQGQTGSCVACAAVSLLEYLENKEGSNFVDLSRMFLYYYARAAEGNASRDSGTTIRGALRILAKKGTCPENLWKFRDYRLLKKPTAACDTAALDHQILYYLKLYNLQDVRACLAAGYPAIVGLQLHESFESQAAEETGIIPMPAANEELLGGHAISIFGYTPDYFICRNSWGRNWGEEGYFYIKPEFLQKYGSDMWTVRDFEFEKAGL